MNDQEVLDIARTVRSAAIRHPNACYDLSCWCAICSFHIFKKIRNIRKKVYFAMVALPDGEAHCFVNYDNKIVDVTATQFREREAVVIGDIESVFSSKKWYWDKSLMRKFSSIKSIQKALEEWPANQNPFYVDFCC